MKKEASIFWIILGIVQFVMFIVSLFTFILVKDSGIQNIMEFFGVMIIIDFVVSGLLILMAYLFGFHAVEEEIEESKEDISSSQNFPYIFFR